MVDFDLQQTHKREVRSIDPRCREPRGDVRRQDSESRRACHLPVEQPNEV